MDNFFVSFEFFGDSLLSFALNRVDVVCWVEVEGQTRNLVDPALLRSVSVLPPHVLTVSLQGVFKFGYAVRSKLKFGLNSINRKIAYKGPLPVRLSVLFNRHIGVFFQALCADIGFDVMVLLDLNPRSQGQVFGLVVHRNVRKQILDGVTVLLFGVALLPVRRNVLDVRLLLEAQMLVLASSALNIKLQVRGSLKDRLAGRLGWRLAP